MDKQIEKIFNSHKSLIEIGDNGFYAITDSKFDSIKIELKEMFCNELADFASHIDTNGFNGMTIDEIKADLKQMNIV